MPGKLNGVIAATTPSGWRIMCSSMPGAMSSLFRPCINAGIDWGQTGDFEGKPKFGPAWDIGAYEFWIYGNAFSGGMKMTTKHFISDN